MAIRSLILFLEPSLILIVLCFVLQYFNKILNNELRDAMWSHSKSYENNLTTKFYYYLIPINCSLEFNLHDY